MVGLIVKSSPRANGKYSPVGETSPSNHDYLMRVYRLGKNGGTGGVLKCGA